MRRRIILTALLFLVMLVMPLPAATKGEDSVTRFSLIVGSNYGAGRVRLRYAVSDARSFMRVLTVIGGVQIPNCTLLIEPGREQLRASLDEMKAKIMRVSGARRVEFIFYYSGHSDEEGLLLGRERISYGDIRRSIEGMPADVRIAILDSCSSGAFTRMKGGRAHAPFMVDSAYSMKGYAFLTSSSADEASQESERIKGSFFTHYLVSGLRGAADMNDDKRITLNEAYQFAYSETLARTEKTFGGAQHPNYHIKMTGAGDVIITDIRGRTAGLVVGREVYGRLFIRDGSKNLVAELSKPAGRSVTLMLDDGKYTAVNDRDGKIYEADIILKRNARAVLQKRDFVETKREYALARGDVEDLRPSEEEYRNVPVNLTFASFKPGNENVVSWFSLSLATSYCARLTGLDLGLGIGRVEEYVKGAQINYIANYIEGNLYGLQLSQYVNYAGGDAIGLQINQIVNSVGGNCSFLQISGIYNFVGKNMYGAQITCLTNVARGRANGLQIGCLWNYAGGGLNGMQISSVNISRGDAYGPQISCLANHTTGSAMFNTQISGIYNYAGKDMGGAQITGIGNIAGETAIGTQISGLWNYSGKDLKGIQVTGIVNIAGEKANGLQISSIGNYAGGGLNGAQVSLINVAGATKGMQLGIVNVAGDTKGVQFSLINVAREMTGLQFGLINVAKEMHGLPVGLINIAGNGQIGAVAWWSSLSTANLGIRFRINHFYTMLAAGGMNYDSEDRDLKKSFNTQFFMGFRVDLWKFLDDEDVRTGRMFADVDAGYVHLDNDPIYGGSGTSDRMALQGRLMVGYNIIDGLSVFGGGGASYLWDYGKFNKGGFEPLYLAGVSYEF